MCDDNQNLEEWFVHGLIGVMGVDYDAYNAWATNHFQVTNDSWQPWGADDPNDTRRPFGKMLAISPATVGRRTGGRQLRACRRGSHSGVSTGRSRAGTVVTRAKAVSPV